MNIYFNGDGTDTILQSGKELQWKVHKLFLMRSTTIKNMLQDTKQQTTENKIRLPDSLPAKGIELCLQRMYKEFRSPDQLTTSTFGPFFLVADFLQLSDALDEAESTLPRLLQNASAENAFSLFELLFSRNAIDKADLCFDRWLSFYPNLQSKDVNRVPADYKERYQLHALKSGSVEAFKDEHIDVGVRFKALFGAYQSLQSAYKSVLQEKQALSTSNQQMQAQIAQLQLQLQQQAQSYSSSSYTSQEDTSDYRPVTS